MVTTNKIQVILLSVFLLGVYNLNSKTDPAAGGGAPYYAGGAPYYSRSEADSATSADEGVAVATYADLSSGAHHTVSTGHTLSPTPDPVSDEHRKLFDSIETMLQKIQDSQVKQKCIDAFKIFREKWTAETNRYGLVWATGNKSYQILLSDQPEGQEYLLYVEPETKSLVLRYGISGMKLSVNQTTDNQNLMLTVGSNPESTCQLELEAFDELYQMVGRLIDQAAQPTVRDGAPVQAGPQVFRMRDLIPR